MATEADFARIGNYARMYNPDQGIDRSKCTRTTPMEVLVLSMSRTGTLSMQSALAKLGLPNPYHFSSMYDNIADTDMWLRAFDAKFRGRGSFTRKHWDALLGHCGAVTDMPANIFSTDLAAAYPNAKIILTERPLERWLPSIDQLFVASMSPFFRVMGLLDYASTGRISAVGHACYRYQFGADDLRGLRRNAERTYREHYALIRAMIPKERILEYRLGTGWEPICEFLGKEVPDEEFPWLNESESIKKVFESHGKVALGRAVRNVVFWTSVVVVPIAGIVWAKRSGRLGDVREVVRAWWK